MDWVRGERIGHGSFGMVSLAIPRSQASGTPELMAVKSCGIAHSASLMNEKLILDQLKGCPEIVSCFGDNYSFENGQKLYNVLLEYASGGSLADRLMNSGDRCLPESQVRQYTKAILRGLEFIHKNGYVHCDIKLQNILLAHKGGVKIADFGLAKRRSVSNDFGCELRGTPMYMSPEMVAGGDQDCPADIWALGCSVAEMITGAPAWRYSDMAGMLMRIGVGDEIPEIPRKLSEQGKDFLGKCFAKDPRNRWTAQMLLSHPFVSDLEEDDMETVSEEVPSTSPRCPWDYPDWMSDQSSSLSSLPSHSDFHSYCSHASPSISSPPARLKGLVSDHMPDWFVQDEWLTVR